MQSAVWGFPIGYMQYIESLATVTESNKNYSDKEKYYDEGVKYFSRDAVKEIVIKGSHITTIPEKSLNYLTSVTKLTIPSTLTKIGNEGCARLNSLRTLCVEGSGMDFDGVIDLRYITSQEGNSFSELCAKGDHYVLLSETSCNLTNSAWGQNSGTGTFYVFVPAGVDESCLWISSMKNLSWGSPNYVYRDIKYSITLCNYPSSRAVTEVGYQVRTSSYNGLRCQFAFDESAATPTNYTAKKLTWDLNGWTKDTAYTGSGSKVVYEVQPNGWVAQDTSEASLTLKEWGTIAATEANVNAYGYALVNNGDAYVTADSKIVKVSNTDLEVKVVDGKFFVTIVNYNTKEQMEAPIFMSGYEIWTDETTGLDFIFYTANDAGHMNVSIFDAVIGMYQYGLINKSMESDNAFWSILDNCRVDLRTTKNQDKIDEFIAAGKTYTYSFAEDGSVIDKSGAGVKVSVFKSKDFSTGEDKYVGIVSSNGSATTFTGGKFNYQIPNSTKWTAGNLLSPNYLGVTIDTLVIDDDIKAATDSGALGMYRDCARVIIYPDNIKLGGQTFNGNRFTETFIPFSKCTSSTDWDSFVGVLDASRADLSSSELQWTFNGMYKFTTVLLPSGSKTPSGTLTTGFFKDSNGKITKVYCPDYYEENGLTPEKGTADFRGTNYVFDYTQEEIKGSNAVFRNSLGIIKAISSDGTVSYRSKSGTSYAQSQWQLTDPSAS